MDKPDMKLIAILALKEYEQELQKFLNSMEIPVFSEIEIKGFRSKKSDKSMTTNWFGSQQKSSMFSILNFAFLESSQAKRVIDAVSEFNKNARIERPVHAYMLDVEKMV